MKTVEHNILRLEQLLKMYRMSEQELMLRINEGLKREIVRQDIFSANIKISHLKRIDKIFEKGLQYYLDPSNPIVSDEKSIFFRKQKFQTDTLNLVAIKIVNKFEELKLSLSGLAKLSGIEFKRKINTFSTNDSPKMVAELMRTSLYPEFDKNKRNFLKNLIAKLASQDILVFEFVENWNKKEKANIDGFYLQPNVIVLKRHKGYSREIFTLAHELGHFLLREEEIETLDESVLNAKGISKTERWCNDFAYFFLVGNYTDFLDSLEIATAKNDYHHETVASISANTHLSKLAIFTRFLYHNQISEYDYNQIQNEFFEQYAQEQREEEQERERQKEEGFEIKKRVPKPIKSPLLISTIQSAYYEGVLNEYEVCKTLNIKPEKLDSYI